MEKGIKEFWNFFRRKIYNHRLKVQILICLISAGAVFLIFYLLSPLFLKLIHQSLVGSKTAFSLLTADVSSLDSFKGRTNLVLLGVRGNAEKGDDLTDTIIFVSIDKKTADTVMLSIPRDVWVDTMQTKINALYHYGEQNETGAGFVMVKDALYQILGQPVHYGLLIDFKGFEKAVDLLNGIEVKVDRAFDDYRYPIAGKENDNCGGDPEYKCRYEHIHFDAGVQQMDGKRALKFVRSRNAEGEEGTDFARSQRQQKVISAFAKKLFSYQTLLDPGKISQLRKTFGEHIQFDKEFTAQQTTAFLSLFIKFVKNNNSIRTFSLDYGNEENLGFLYHPENFGNGQWILLPRGDSWGKIQEYVKEKIYKGY